MKRLALILFAALIAACSATAPHSDAPAAKTRAVGDIDLSYVDLASPEYARFKAYVDRNLTATNPDYGWSAIDPVYECKITGVANVILKTSMDRLRNVTTDLLALYEERQARQEYDILGDGST